jgi:exodeoxyribonuclease III
VKIITWNVNGLRAALDKGIWDWVKAQEADVVCFQEIKAKPEQLTTEQIGHFDGWEAYWHPAQRPGYSGVLTLTRQGLASPKPLEVQYGIGFQEFDIEGRLVCTRYPAFTLFNAYFPNGQHDHGRVGYKLEFYSRLLEISDRLHAAGERVVMCGDFNTAHNEIDLRNPKENANSTGFLAEERIWIDQYEAHGLVDVYRHLYPERVQYTWWTYRFNARKKGIGWRLDYFMISEALVRGLQDVVVHDDVLGSDHCPVSVIFSGE